MVVVKNIAIGLDLDAKKFNEGAAEAAKSMKGLKGGISGGFATVAAGAAIAVVAIEKIAKAAYEVGKVVVDVFKASTQHVRDLAEQSEKTGQSIKSLSGGLLTNDDIAGVQAFDIAMQELQNSVLSLTAAVAGDAITALTAYALAIKSIIENLDTNAIDSFITALASSSTVLSIIHAQLKLVAEDFKALAESQSAVNKGQAKLDLFKKLKSGLEADPNENPVIKAAREGGLHESSIAALQKIIDQQAAVTAEKEKQLKAEQAAEQAAKAAASAKEKAAQAAKAAADKAAEQSKQVAAREQAEQDKQAADRKQDAQRIVDSSKSAGEKFHDSLSEISDLLNTGNLTKDQAAKAAEQLFENTQQSQQPDGPKLASATLSGTSDFISKLQKIAFPDDDKNAKLEKNTREQAEYSRKLYEYWTRSTGVAI